VSDSAQVNPVCPKCKRDFVQRVAREGFFERLGGLLSISAFRCQLCTYRFYGFQLGAGVAKQPVDRRQYVRFAVRLPATFSGEARGEGTVVDLSMGGCAIETDVRVPTGKVLQVRITISDTETPVGVEAGVVRSVRGAIIGVEFLRLVQYEKDRLSRYIAGLLLARKNVTGNK
jgi:hypothetical protein